VLVTLGVVSFPPQSHPPKRAAQHPNRPPL
jgi:hypothetical protein